MMSQKIIPRGAGLSYVLNSAGADVLSIQSKRFDRILNKTSDSITVETGLSIGELCFFLEQAGYWIAPIPGYPSITIGGCVAANVHGKSQFHTGCFKDWVLSLRLMLVSGEMIECSPHQNADLFHLTVGGYGSTGFILDVTLKIEKMDFKCIDRQTIKAKNLLSALEILKSNESVMGIYSWNDFNDSKNFGRGFVYVDRKGFKQKKSKNFAEGLRHAPRSHPIAEFMTSMTPVILSKAYPAIEQFKPDRIDLDFMTAQFPFVGKEIYHPLFGKRGLLEYQMLIPWENTDRFVAEFKKAISDSGVRIAMGSLKLFRGKQDLLNFNGTGVCFSVDVLCNTSSQKFFAILDQLVIKNQGIPNLSKDSRLPPTVIKKCYPELSEFLNKTEKINKGCLKSDFLDRLKGER
jgi:decaprenylphospho-beta-D-ribofuranose 2-oxidase